MHEQTPAIDLSLGRLTLLYGIPEEKIPYVLRCLKARKSSFE